MTGPVRVSIISQRFCKLLYRLEILHSKSSVSPLKNTINLFVAKSINNKFETVECKQSSLLERKSNYRKIKSFFSALFGVKKTVNNIIFSDNSVRRLFYFYLRCRHPDKAWFFVFAKRILFISPSGDSFVPFIRV